MGLDRSRLASARVQSAARPQWNAVFGRTVIMLLPNVYLTDDFSVTARNHVRHQAAWRRDGSRATCRLSPRSDRPRCLRLRRCNTAPDPGEYRIDPYVAKLGEAGDPPGSDAGDEPLTPQA